MEKHDTQKACKKFFFFSKKMIYKEKPTKEHDLNKKVSLALALGRAQDLKTPKTNTIYPSKMLILAASPCQISTNH